MKTSQIVTGLTVGKQVSQIAQSGPTGVNGRFQDHLNRIQQGQQLFVTQLPTGRQRVDTSQVKRLICVDVSQPCQWALVKQQGFDRCRPTCQRRGQFRHTRGCGPGIRTQSAKARRAELVLVIRRNKPERPRIDKPDLGAVVEPGDKMRVLHDFF